MFTLELARRLEGTGVTANALHPGLVATNFSSGNGAYGWFMRQFVGRRGISAEQGATTVVYLATSPEVDGVSGQYFVDERPAPCSRAASDPVTGDRLWRVSQDLTGGRGPSPNRSAQGEHTQTH